MPIAVSVVVPCYQAAGYLNRCIGSLAAQTLPKEQFEAVLIFNGPDDGGEALARQLLRGAGINHQILHSAAGAGRARNVGIAAAGGAWTTLLDADDELSADFLALLLESAADPTVVPVTGIVDESYDGVALDWWHNATLIENPGPQSPELFYPHLSLNAGKLIPTAAMQRHPFDEELRSGEDVALYCALFDAESLSMTAAPAIQGARYRRHVTATSVSRQQVSFEFMVTQRLAVIRELNRQLAASPGRLDGVRRLSITSQARFVRRYLRQHPHERDAVLDAVAAEDLAHMDPKLRPAPPRRALVCGDFAPSGTAESRGAVAWLLAEGDEWQVVSSASAEEPDSMLDWTTALAVARHDRIPVRPGRESERAVDEFVTAALASLADLGELDTVTTFGPWLAPHLAGAAHAARTGADWVALPTAPLTAADLSLESWRNL